MSRAVADARESGRMTAEHEVRALLGDQLAAACDKAAAGSESDLRGLLSASERLLEVLDTLPIRPLEVPGGGAAGVGSGERGRVLELLDSPPQVGHAADA